MILSVIRELAEKHELHALLKAATEFEETQSNSLGVKGKDEGEILTNLLMACEVRKRMDGGATLVDAVREHARMIQGIIAPKKI